MTGVPPASKKLSPDARSSRMLLPATGRAAPSCASADRICPAVPPCRSARPMGSTAEGKRVSGEIEARWQGVLQVLEGELDITQVELAQRPGELLPGPLTSTRKELERLDAPRQRRGERFRRGRGRELLPNAPCAGGSGQQAHHAPRQVPGFAVARPARRIERLDGDTVLRHGAEPAGNGVRPRLGLHPLPPRGVADGGKRRCTSGGGHQGKV